MVKEKINKKALGSLVTLHPPCYYCDHLIDVGSQFSVSDIEGSLKGWTCKAFPQGIPYDVLRRYTKHDEVFKGYQVGERVFRSKRINTGGGDTGYQFITFEGEWLNDPE